MGTRSLTHVIDHDFGEPKHILTIYRQYDGDPKGHGIDVAEFIASRDFVNGISGDATKVFNGAGCFAAALVTHLKADRNVAGLEGEIEAGGVYIHPLDSAPEEYNYTITIAGPEVSMRIEDWAGGLIFEGSPDEFLNNIPQEA